MTRLRISARSRAQRRTLVVLVALVALTSAPLHAVTQIAIDPPPPYFLDDRITVTVVTTFHIPAGVTALPAPPSVVVRGHGINFTHDPPGCCMASYTQIWTGTFESIGQATIDIEAPRPIEGPTHLSLTVGPPLLHSWTDPSAVVQELIAARREPAIVVAEVSRSQAYLGESVSVIWSQITADDGVENGPLKFPPTIGFDPSDPQWQAFQSGSVFQQKKSVQVSVGGRLLWKRQLRRIRIKANALGTIEIPAMHFTAGGIVYSQTRTSPSLRIPVTFDRLSNALRIEVLPRPKAAGDLPIGPFTIECRDPYSFNYWPSQIVRVSGESLDTIRSFRLDKAPYATIILKPSKYYDVYEWLMIAHRRSLDRLPSPTLDYFDPMTNTVRSVTCGTSVKSTVMRADIQSVDLQSIRVRRNGQAAKTDVFSRVSGPDAAVLWHLARTARFVMLFLTLAGLIGIVFALRL